ncbi:MAG: transporter substrate-binding domain-containing protein [Bacteroidota bacterium]
MKKLISCLLVICSVFVLNSCNKEDITGKDLRIICENLRPYSYIEGDQLKGISAEIVGSIMYQMELKEMTVEIADDWDLAYSLLKTSDNVALFTTDLTAARKDKFQWVGPITVYAIGFMGLKSSSFDISSFNEAKDLPSVGVVTGYSSTETLEKKDFGNLEYFSTLSDAIAALYAGTVSTVCDIIHSIKSTAIADGRDATQLIEVFNFSTTQGFIAFSEGVSPKLVASWQEKLDELKEDGTVQDIYDEYLPGETAPGLVTIYTEENPPQNYRKDDGSITGSSVEIVEALMDVIEREEPVNMTTWNDAYEQALLAPNSMVFSTVRTAERDTLFEWIGPVCKRNYCFYVRSNGTVSISSIEEAKGLSSIGVPDGWAAVDELEELGFTNITTYGTPEKVFQKLMDGKVDAAVLNDIAIKYLAVETGYAPEDVTFKLLLSSGQSYLAFSKDTKTEYIQEWQQALTTIMNNGNFAGIWEKWYPDIDW